MPREHDAVERRIDSFDNRRMRIAGAGKVGGIHRQRYVGEGRLEERLDRALKPASHRQVIAVDLHPVLDQRRFEEQRVARARGAPQHAPVADAGRVRLPAVGAETNEGILHGHEEGGGINGQRHG